MELSKNEVSKTIDRIATFEKYGNDQARYVTASGAGFVQTGSQGDRRLSPVVSFCQPIHGRARQTSHDVNRRSTDEGTDHSTGETKRLETCNSTEMSTEHDCNHMQECEYSRSHDKFWGFPDLWLFGCSRLNELQSTPTASKRTDGKLHQPKTLSRRFSLADVAVLQQAASTNAHIDMNQSVEDAGFRLRPHVDGKLAA